MARSAFASFECANPLEDDALPSLWTQALHEMTENCNRALGETPNLWLFGIINSEGQVEPFLYHI